MCFLNFKRFRLSRHLKCEIHVTSKTLIDPWLLESSFGTPCLHWSSPDNKSKARSNQTPRFALDDTLLVLLSLEFPCSNLCLVVCNPCRLYSHGSHVRLILRLLAPLAFICVNYAVVSLSLVSACKLSIHTFRFRLAMCTMCFSFHGHCKLYANLRPAFPRLLPQFARWNWYMESADSFRFIHKITHYLSPSLARPLVAWPRLGFPGLEAVYLLEPRYVLSSIISCRRLLFRLLLNFPDCWIS
ncbi:hypothetical protein V1511DRAFT_6868 [Dipodascopsis uninucleata]